MASIRAAKSADGLSGSWPEGLSPSGAAFGFSSLEFWGGTCDMQLASSHRFSENIFVPAIVIPELKFRDIKREIFSANLVERSDDSALEIDQKPSIVLVWIA